MKSGIWNSVFSFTVIKRFDKLMNETFIKHQIYICLLSVNNNCKWKCCKGIELILNHKMD